MHELTWTRDGAPMRGFFQLRKEQWDDEFGQHYERYVFRTDDWVPERARPPRAEPAPASSTPLRRGVEETGSVIKFISVGMLRLVAGAAVASRASAGRSRCTTSRGRRARRGPAYFVWAMALISVNLGLINLLPIPVLDGGHLLFFLFEAARRRPLPLRVREVASLVGHGRARRRSCWSRSRTTSSAGGTSSSRQVRELMSSRDARPPHGRRARDVAAHVLVRVEKDDAFAAAALDAELARAVQLDARDRALATELVYGTLRVCCPGSTRGSRSIAPRGIEKLDAAARAPT